MQMTNAEFKKILATNLTDRGFVKNSNNFYYRSDETTIVINTQKSNNDNSFYINYGFFVNSIHQECKYPTILETDVRGRFRCENFGNIKDRYLLDQINAECLIDSINNNLSKVIFPTVNKGIREYFEIFPSAINTATIRLKQYLEI